MGPLGGPHLRKLARVRVCVRIHVARVVVRHILLIHRRVRCVERLSRRLRPAPNLISNSKPYANSNLKHGINFFICKAAMRLFALKVQASEMPVLWLQCMTSGLNSSNENLIPGH